MNFNLVEMYNGLLRFNKHILNELAEGLKHLPNLDGVSKGDSLIINEQGNPAWGSAAFIPTFENAAYGIEWTKVHPFIISHTKTMTRTREDGKEEVFSACIKHDDTRYLGGNKSSSIVATKLQGRPRTGINYDKANEFCANRGDWITMIDYLEYCALQALCYIEYANFDNQAALNTNLTSEGFKQGGLGAGVTDLNWDRWTAFNGKNPIVQTYWTAEHNIGNGSTNGDHYELGNYNTDGSNFNTYPAVYRGILNFFGDIWTFIRDVVIVNRNANYNSVYLLKKRC